VTEYVRGGPNGYSSYQFTMSRQERIGGKWSDTPDRMIVKTTREPLRVYAKWLPDGALARAQSNHLVKDLGTEFIANLYLSEGRKYQEAGVQRPTRVEAKTIDGVRVVALTYETPTSRPQFYAKKETLGLDLHQPYFRTVESYDNDGRIFERIVIEKIAPKTFDDTAFDPKNPDYAF
jgi:hypothetical protein